MFRDLKFALVFLGAVTTLAWPQSRTVDTVTLKPHEVLVLRTLTSVSSETAKVGDPVRFELIKPVKVGPLIAIAVGAVANGKVALVEKKRSKGHGGKLGITIDDIQTVTGEAIKLLAYDEKQAGNHRANDIGSLIMAGPLPGAGAMLIPVALLMPGNEMLIGKGTRFTAVTENATVFDFDALAKAQPAPIAPSPNIAELYIYRNGDNHPEDPDEWPVAIGEELVGWLRPGRFIFLRLPPGIYWLHHTAGDRSGNIRIDKEKPKDLFELRAEGGQTYYVRQNVTRVVGWTKGPLTHMEQVKEAIGSEEVSELFAPGSASIDPDAALQPNSIEYSNPALTMHTKCYLVPNQVLARMQAQPGAEERKKRKAAIIAKQEVDCKLPEAPGNSAANSKGPALRDGTPVSLSLRKAISSATAQVGEKVEFETTADVKVGEAVIIPKGVTVIGTVIEARPKRRLGRAGRLNFSVEYVQLANGNRIPLRATPQVSGKSHGKAVTGAVVGSGVVFFPAAPFMLLRHGGDIDMPEGTAITVFVQGDVALETSKAKAGESAPTAATCKLSFTSPDFNREVTPSTYPHRALLFASADSMPFMRRQFLTPDQVAVRSQ